MAATEGIVTNNYTLGRGEISFARFVTGTQTPKGFRYIGNTPEFSLTIEQEVLDHFNSDHGIREKDESIALQVNRSGTFTTDNIDIKNVAIFFFGEEEVVTEAGATITAEEVNDVEQGLYYQLGISTTRPAGAKGLVAGGDTDSNSGGAFTVVENDSNSAGNTEFVYGTDYTVDPETGRLYVIVGGGIADGTDLQVTYTIRPSTYNRILSGSEPVEGAMQFIAFNPVGDDIDYFFPWIKVSPNGDYALKSDEWNVIPFQVEILKPTSYAAIYALGRPAYA